jgi:hypothetical protein
MLYKSVENIIVYIQQTFSSTESNRNIITDLFLLMYKQFTSKCKCNSVVRVFTDAQLSHSHYALFVYNRLCGPVDRVLGYRSGGPGSIPGTTRKKSSGSGTGSSQPREYN